MRMFTVLTAFSLCCCLLIILCWIPGCRSNTQLEELSVERLNIVEKDGTLRLALFNQEQMPLPVLNGKTYPRRIRGAGMILYNPAGDERGGMVLYQRDSLEMSGMVWDYRNSEGIAMGRYEKGMHQYGTYLSLTDRVGLDQDIEKVGSVGPPRINLGATESLTEIQLFDSHGKARISLGIDSTDQPYLHFLDTTGSIVQSFN
ncbi:MAG: hypothetical protein AAF587_16280 [Bacteroidota bacterium]